MTSVTGVGGAGSGENGSMTMEQKVEALRRTPLFAQISENKLELLAARAVVRRLQRGEVLFTRGGIARGIYVVVSGMLRAFRESEGGREQTIHVERAGAVLGDVPVFDDGPYPSTVMAEENATVLLLEKEYVRKFLLENADVAFAALTVMAARLRKVTALVEELSLRDVAQRLAKMLLDEAAKSGAVEDGVSFSLATPHQRIAAQLGSVREVITRHLGRLVEEQLIEVRGHRIAIVNVAGLQAKTK